MLKTSGEREHPCLFPDYCGKASSFLLSSMMLVAEFFVTFKNQIEEVPSIPSLLKDFIMTECWILSNVSSASIDMIM